MEGFRIKDGFIDFDKTTFSCPYCNKQYNDTESTHLTEQQKQNGTVTKFKCTCGNESLLVMDYRSEYVCFKK